MELKLLSGIYMDTKKGKLLIIKSPYPPRLILRALTSVMRPQWEAKKIEHTGQLLIENYRQHSHFGKRLQLSHFTTWHFYKVHQGIFRESLKASLLHCQRNSWLILSLSTLASLSFLFLILMALIWATIYFQ